MFSNDDSLTLLSKTLPTISIGQTGPNCDDEVVLMHYRTLPKPGSLLQIRIFCLCAGLSPSKWEHSGNAGTLLSSSSQLIALSLIFALQISNPSTDIQGFVARDDHRKEIIVAVRGRCVFFHPLWVVPKLEA